MLDLNLQSCISIRHKWQLQTPISVLNNTDTLLTRYLADLVFLFFFVVEKLFVDDEVFFKAGVYLVSMFRDHKIVLQVFALDALEGFFDSDEFH